MRCFRIPFLSLEFLAHAVSLQRFQRRRSRLLNRCVKPLNGSERFAEPYPKARGSFPKGVKNVLFPRSLPLLTRKGISAGTIHGVQTNHVLAAQAPNCPGQDRRTS